MPEILDDFGKSLLDPSTPAPRNLQGPHNGPVGNRFNVYRNNVVLGLTNALAESFPVIRKLLGERSFRDVANIFVRAHPPNSPLMMFYGSDFPTFLTTFQPLAHLPYLADTARLEFARRECFHAADAKPIAPEKLGEIAEHALPLTRLHLHPSMRLITSPYPIFSIWRYNMSDDQSPLPAHGEDVLIARPFAEVEMRVLPAGAIAFLTALGHGKNLEKSIESGTKTAPDFDPIAQLSGLLAANLIIEIT